MFILAGVVIASLLPLPSAKPLGIDSAEADACESESRSGSSGDIHAEQDDTDAAVAAGYVLPDQQSDPHALLQDYLQDM